MAGFLVALLFSVAVAVYTVERLGSAGWATLFVSDIVVILVLWLTLPRNPRGGAHP